MVDLGGVTLLAGRPYKASETWRHIHEAVRGAPHSSPLLRELFGAPVPPPSDRVFLGETPRISAARSYAAAANAEVLASVSRRVLAELQEQAFAAVTRCLAQQQAEGEAGFGGQRPRSAGTLGAGATLPAVLLFGALHPADNTVYLERLEGLILKQT
jgi:hypothetical protein